MSSGTINKLALTVIAASAHIKHRFIGHDAATAVAGGGALGVASQNQNQGDASNVEVLGVSVVDSAEPIPANSKIEVGADGKAAVFAAGTVVGVTAPGASATAADQKIEVLLIQNA